MIVLNNVSVYYQLARQMGADRPFIDIQTYHPDGPLDLPALQLRGFRDLRRAPHPLGAAQGPYLLGGHCVYGALAFEAARQLQRMGEKIELVCLFDSWAPGYREAMSPHDQKLRKRQLRMHLRPTASSSTARARSA